MDEIPRCAGFVFAVEACTLINMKHLSDETPVAALRSPDESAAGALNEIRGWADALFAAYPAPPVSRSHDAGTGLTPLATLIRHDRRTDLLEYLAAFREESLAFYEREGLMRHGYWREQEAHHGPEYYQIFLYTLGMLDPTDSQTVHRFRAATDYVGHWNGGPIWFDPDTGLFRSLFLGSEGVGAETVNAPDHIRFADLCLKCYRLTGEKRYRDAGLGYLRRWAEPIAEAEHLPAALDRRGTPLNREELLESDYRSFVGQLLPVEPEVAAAENLVASGAVGLFLAAWKETGDDLYVDACERLIDALIPALEEPAAWQVPALIRRYRQTTGRTRYDGRISAVRDEAVREITNLKIVDKPPRPANRFIGDRTDKPDWFDQDGEPAPNPVLVSLKAEVTDDDELWARSLSQAEAYLHLARTTYGPYVDHGCTGKAFHAVARGHGRLDAAGVVTEVLNPFLGLPNPEVV